MGLCLVTAAGIASGDSDVERARELLRQREYRGVMRLLAPLVAGEQGADAEVHELYGVAALGLGDHGTALGHLRRARDLNPGNPETLKWLCKATLLAGRKREAQSLLEELTRLAPEDGEGWSLLGWLYQDRSLFPRAVAALERALELRPGDVVALVALANAQVGLGRHEEARASFERGVSLNARLARPLAGPHASFAVFLLRLNRVEEARGQLRKAQAIDPDEPVTLLAARVLAQRTEGSSAQAAPGGRGPVPRFEDIAPAAGLDLTLENCPTPAKHQIETMPGGVAVLDYDGDGALDLYFTNGADSPSLAKSHPRYWNRLYRNAGDGSFTDVTEEAGVRGSGYAMGAAAGDFDNDGLSDLFVVGVDHNILYRNLGGGRFRDVTEEAGLGRPHPRFGRMWGIHAAWLDYDNDGWLDLLVVNYCRWDPKTEPFCGDPGRGIRVYCHPGRYGALPNQLFRNNGDGSFTDVSASSGLDRHLGKGMGAAVADFDGDGFSDVFVANDTEPNFLFRNGGHGRFEEVALEMGVAVNQFGIAPSSMGADFRDLDNDGRPDLFVTALSNEGFLLFRNAGESFRDIGDEAEMGLASLPYSGWSNAIADLNNDGWKDLLSANGHAMDNVDLMQARVYEQRSALFLNQGDGTFRDVSSQVGPDFQREAAHRGLAVADFDDDGRLDVVVTALGDRPELFRNVTPEAGHWLLVRLRGRRSNRDGFGAVLRLETEDGRVLWNHASASVGFACSSDPRVHFGLGASAGASRLEVRWPSGTRQVLEDVAADRVLTVEEPP